MVAEDNTGPLRRFAAAAALQMQRGARRAYQKCRRRGLQEKHPVKSDEISFVIYSVIFRVTYNCCSGEHKKKKIHNCQGFELRGRNPESFFEAVVTPDTLLEASVAWEI